MVESIEQAQKAVRFTKEKNLRLVIKSTGHDAGGRSSAVDSFQILTHRLKNITFADHFVPVSGIINAAYESEGPAVTIGAGVLAKELYAAGAAQGYAIVAGEVSSVGISGGFVQGGGVSTALAPMRGLVADLALQFELITSDGEFVIANKYQNQDLFWALRGGGGGTFGLVTSVTMCVFPDIPAVISSLYFEMSERNETYWMAVKEVVYKTRELSTGDNSGEYWIGRTETGKYYLRLTMFFIHETNTTAADGTFALLLVSLRIAGVSYQFNSTCYVKLSSFLALPQGELFGGLSYYQENVLISQDYFGSSAGPARMVDQLAQIDLNPNDAWMINILGGQVNTNKVDNAVHPGWRSAAILAAILLAGNRFFGPTFKEQQAVQERMTTVEGPVLQSIEPSAFAMFLNEADPNLKDWQWWFWGKNYGRLLEIKGRRDPDGLFIVRHGVGSEKWDEDGICRVN